MNHEYHLPLRLWHWLRRIRHRCGYGIHSPRAFDFVTSIIYCSEAYYAYEPLRAPLKASLSRLDEYDPDSGLIAKDLRLIFRLANYTEATHIALYGTSPAIDHHISAARPSAHLSHPSSPFGAESSAAATSSSPFGAEPPAIATSSSPFGAEPPAVEPIGLIYSHTPASHAQAVDSYIDGPTSPTAMIIIHAPHHTTAARHAWQRLVDSPAATLTFDLGRFGIALKCPKINPQHYVINYF